MRIQKLIPTVLTSGNRRYPYSVDFATLGDGALPGQMVGATWAISGGRAVNTPGLGAELLTNPGGEGVYSTGLAPNWQALANTGTRAESTDVHGGTAAQQIAATAAQRQYVGPNNATVTAGNWYQGILWLKRNSGSSRVNLRPAGGVAIQIVTPAGTGYMQYVLTGRATDTGLTIACDINGPVTGAGDVILDDASIKQITTADLFAYYQYPVTAPIVRAGWTITPGSNAGVVGWWDKANVMQNCLTAQHNGTNATLAKYVGTTRTQLVSAAAPYVAGALIEIRRLPGTNTFQLWYNGAQVGTDQTVSDAEIINNQYYGLLSTCDGSGASSFALPF